ncbi:MAG: aldo/keto reductase [Bifidobacterium sp.]|nr:aldo/keto reductase [Bifidobacterium sp.]
MTDGRYLTQTIALNTTYQLPVEGYGTWLTPNDQAATGVHQAIKDGYRLIDTAHDYGNEQGVGEGIHRAMDELGLKREDLFITTKVDADIMTAEQTAASVDESLNKLGVDYVDLILIHAPRPWKYMDATPGPDGDHFYEKNRIVWAQLEQSERLNYTHSIGLSQFSVDDMEHLTKHATLPPAVLQTEAYAGNLPRGLMAYCQEHHIAIQAFCPLGHGRILDDPTLRQVAAHYGTGTAQVCLKYLIQHGFSVIPKSLDPAHIEADTKLDFTITDADMHSLDELDLSHALDGL